MIKGQAMIIEPLGNGWLVRPLHMHGVPFELQKHARVLNDLGVAASASDAFASSLATFVVDHFGADEVGEA